MLKSTFFIVLLLTVVHGQAPNNSSIEAPKSITQTTSSNSTQQAKTEISENTANAEKNEQKNIGTGEAKLINTHPVKESMIGDEVSDTETFKYYWVLLVFSSLSIIGLIVFKSFRLRRTRAEVKYGKPQEADEIQPLGKSKWDDVDSSENEDEIFDINFLKNTRLNPTNDV